MPEPAPVITATPPLNVPRVVFTCAVLRGTVDAISDRSINTNEKTQPRTAF
jgi:hypothetical protein